MTRSFHNVLRPRISTALICTAFIGLSACDDTGNFDPSSVFAPRAEAKEQETTSTPGGETVERDVEAPEVFSTTEAALWDGRPSLGGVWVAHPDVTEPERVLIRNTANGETVVGALFRREREVPGPRLQLSSDAAVALGVLAGAPVSLDVVALRKEVVEIAPPEAAPVDVEPPAEIEETKLGPIEAAAAAIDASEVAEAASAPAPAVSSNLPEVALSRPYLQAGTFNKEENATRAVKILEDAGVMASARAAKSSDKEVWRVIVGPLTTPAVRDAALAKVKAAGFKDAFPVSG